MNIYNRRARQWYSWCSRAAESSRSRNPVCFEKNNKATNNCQRIMMCDVRTIPHCNMHAATTAHDPRSLRICW